MRSIYIKTLVIILFTLLSVGIVAQNKVTVSKRNPIYLELSNIYRAGAQNIVLADDSQWLNYTILIEAQDPTVSISASINSGSIPKGMELYVEASNYKGFSRGKVGRSNGRIALSHMPQVLIHNIGTSYTGSGRNEGHQLKFFFKIIDYAKLEPGLHTIYVEYTITQ